MPRSGLGIFARRPPEPVRLPVPDLGRPRRPAGGLDRWAQDVRTYTAQAMDRAETRGGDVLPLACKALVAYFDAGDNDDAQMQTLRDMVGSGVRLGAAFAAVERLAGVDGSSTDPRVREAMATSTTPEATGMGFEASAVLSLAVDVGHFAAKAGDEGLAVRMVLRETATEQADRVLRELNA